MLEESTFFGYRVALDKGKTENWYAQAAPWGCDCGDCRHFLKLACQGKLPEEIRKVLRELEIPPEKATYVSSLYREKNQVLYQFSYRLAGTILAAPENGREDPCGRCCRDPYPYGAPGFPEPHFDLEFYCKFPIEKDTEMEK